MTNVRGRGLHIRAKHPLPRAPTVSVFELPGCDPVHGSANSLMRESRTRPPMQLCLSGWVVEKPSAVSKHSQRLHTQ